LRQIQVLHVPVTGYYGDINGNRLEVIPKNGSEKTQGTSCPDLGSTESSQEFVSMEREYTCNVGYRFVVTYRIVSEFYLLNSIGSTASGGRIRLKNSSGQYYYTTPASSKAPVTITNNGVVSQNSEGADLNEFIVSFRTEYVSETDFAGAVAIEPNLFVLTDCSNYPTLTIPFAPKQAAIGSQQNSFPCSRVDRVYWNPKSGSTPPSLTGANPVGSTCFPFGYVFPNKQEVEFKNSSGQWKPFYLKINGLGQPGVQQSLINYWDVWYIDVSASQTNNGLVPGNVEVRFRNNQMGSTSNGGPCVTEPAGTYIYETWVIN